jgi:hypothetical protein
LTEALTFIAVTPTSCHNRQAGLRNVLFAPLTFTMTLDLDQ